MVVLIATLGFCAVGLYLGYRHLRSYEGYVDSLYLTGEDWFE